MILGGWHPSLLPDQTLAADYVDIIVKGQGEDAFLEIVQRIEQRESLAGIAGVAYKDAGRMVFNPPRPLRPIAEMPPKAYHLADFDAYQRVCGRRWAMYTAASPARTTAHTAPTPASTDGNGTRSDPSRSARKLPTWSAYGLQLLWIVDDNFLVDRDRAVGIAEGIVRRGVSSIGASRHPQTSSSRSPWTS